MIFFNIVFFLTIGTKYIERTDLLPSLDIGILLAFVEVIFTYSVESIRINKDLMYRFSAMVLLIIYLAKRNNRRESVPAIRERRQEIQIDPRVHLQERQLYNNPL